METLKTIHIGCGGRGAGHLRKLMEMDMWEPVGLVDVVDQFFDDAVQAYDLPREHCFTTLSDALNIVDANAAIISTPAAAHTQFIEEALNAGLHVWVEKPFTCDLASARRCVEIAEKRGMKLMVGNQMRFGPAPRTFRRLLAEEIAGKPGYVSFIQNKVRPTPYNPSPHEQLWQMCSHNFDTIRAILKRKPVSICAHSYVPPWSDYKESAVVTAEMAFEDGMTLCFLSSSDSKSTSYEMRVECGEGALIQTHQTAGDGIKLKKANEEEIIPLDEAPNGWPVDTWQFMMFYDYVTKDIEPETSGRNNLPTIQILDAAQRSSETGEVIRDFSSGV